MHRALAQSGCHFLVVNAPEDEQAEQVAALVQSMPAVSAQRYGRFMIEELVEHSFGEPRIAEPHIAEPPDNAQAVDTPAAALR